MILREAEIGYQLGKEAPELNHLLFVDAIKIFAKSECQIDSPMQTVRHFCSDIATEFGISKCGEINLQRTKRCKYGRGILLSSSIGDLAKGCHK